MPVEPLPTTPGRLVTVSVLLLASLTIMANATIAPSLPGLKAHFSDVAGIDTLAGLLLSLPSIGIVLTAGLFGWMADRYDRQKLLAVAAILYAVGGTSGLWAQTLPQMLVGRLVLGVGVAGTMTLGMAWAADLWQGPARARFLGQQGAAMSGGGIVVMLLGGALATLHWRGAFAVYALVLPIGALALSMLAPYARKLNTDRAVRAASPQSAVVADAFPWRAYAFVGTLAFVFMTTFYIVPTRLPFLLHDLGVNSPAIVGAIMASMTLVSIPGALSYGRIRGFLSPISIFALSFALMGSGLFVISQATSMGMVVIGVVLAGIGMGPSMPNYTTYFMGFVPPSQRGRASGLLTTAFFAGQFASPLVTAPLVAAYGLPGAFGIVAIALVVLAAGLLAYSLSQRNVTVTG
jgi:MFS family permease